MAGPLSRHGHGNMSLLMLCWTWRVLASGWPAPAYDSLPVEGLVFGATLPFWSTRCRPCDFAMGCTLGLIGKLHMQGLHPVQKVVLWLLALLFLLRLWASLNRIRMVLVFSNLLAKNAYLQFMELFYLRYHPTECNLYRHRFEDPFVHLDFSIFSISQLLVDWEYIGGCPILGQSNANLTFHTTI
jgi:hypothetical protein